jgi:hypothetical protein
VPLTEREVAFRVLSLPPALQSRALAALRLGALGPPRADRCDIEKHLAYLGRPHDYIRDILCRELIPQQVRIIDAVMEHRKVIFPGGTNLCKSDALSALAVYFLDVEGSAPDANGAPRECQVILGGTFHDSIFNFYEKMLVHANRAEAHGHAMPGARSNDSVMWKVAPNWRVKPVSPPVKAGELVAHSASGTHAGVMFGVLEEAQGAREAIWATYEGMLTGVRNYLVAPLNPTESAGPAYDRTRDGRYPAVHLSAFDHPNVQARENRIEAAVDFAEVDKRVRACDDRGPWPETQPNPTFAEFLYALPPPGAKERGPRGDGIPGHPDGEVHVFRPRGLFEGQVLGQFPANVASGLIRASSWDAAVERWRRRRDPETLPDAVGVDVAREGDDQTVAAPRWGPTAEQMLRDWSEAQEACDIKLMAELQGDARRIRVGTLVPAPPGDGPEVAGYLARRWQPCPPWNVDEGSVGTSPLDHARRVLGVDAAPVSFGGSAPDPVPGEPWCANIRTSMYIRAKMLLELDLLDPPDDPQLRKEMLAPSLIEVELTVPDGLGGKRRASGVRVAPKSEVKEKLGCSPDRADAFVLSLWQAIRRRRVYAGVAE